MSTEESKAESNQEAPTPEVSNEQKLREEMLYMRADFDNTKKRLLRDQENAVRFANEKIISELLSVMDLFERALESGKELKATGSEEAKTFYTGVEMTHRELVHLLNRFGVELIGTVGEKFDPNRHEAVSKSPTEADKVDTVLAVAQKGSLLHGRLLKPAKVVVGVP